MCSLACLRECPRDCVCVCEIGPLTQGVHCESRYWVWRIWRQRGRLTAYRPGPVAQSSIQCFIRREQVYKRNKRLNHCRVGRQEAAARMALKPFEILEELPQVHTAAAGILQWRCRTWHPLPCRDGALGSPSIFFR